MLDRGLTSVGSNNGVVHVEVWHSGDGVGILVVYVSLIFWEDDRGVLGQLAFKSLLG
jgi:hypothetical protein